MLVILVVLLPSYAVSVGIGMVGSKITQKIGVKRALMTALCCMTTGLLLGAFFLDTNIYY